MHVLVYAFFKADHADGARDQLEQWIHSEPEPWWHHHTIGGRWQGELEKFGVSGNVVQVTEELLPRLQQDIEKCRNSYWEECRDVILNLASTTWGSPSNSAVEALLAHTAPEPESEAAVLSGLWFYRVSKAGRFLQGDFTPQSKFVVVDLHEGPGLPRHWESSSYLSALRDKVSRTNENWWVIAVDFDC